MKKMLYIYSDPNWKQEVLDDTSLSDGEKQELIKTYREPRWNPSCGVSPKMVSYICKKNSILVVMRLILQKSVSKNISHKIDTMLL